MNALIWINAASTVMVTRYEDGMKVYVATREHSDATWGPPITCNADEETAKIMSLAAIALDEALNEPGAENN